MMNSTLIVFTCPNGPFLQLWMIGFKYLKTLRIEIINRNFAVNYFRFSRSDLVCMDVAICDLNHDVEACLALH